MVRRLAGTRAGHADSLRQSPEPLTPPARVLVGDTTSPLSIIACSVHRATTSSTSRQAPPPMSVSRMSLTGAPLMRATADQPSQAGSMLRCLPPCRLGHLVPKGRRRPPRVAGSPHRGRRGPGGASSGRARIKPDLAGRHRQTAEREPDHYPAGARTTDDWAVEAAHRGRWRAWRPDRGARCCRGRGVVREGSAFPPRRMRNVDATAFVASRALENATPSGCPQEWATSRR